MGYNSFGYCNNSPVNRIDIDGTFSFWWILFVDHRFGFIHLCVQKHIVSTYPNTYMESWVSKNNSHVGRVDIYKHNGAAWEVKSKNTAYLALEQLENYMGGVVDGGAHTIQYPGPAGEFSGSFAIIYGKMIVVVIYCTPSPGVISYDIHELSEGETCPEDHYEYIRNITSPVQTPKPATVDTPVFIPLPGGGGGQPQYSYNGSGGGWSFGFARFCSAVC